MVANYGAEKVTYPRDGIIYLGNITRLYRRAYTYTVREREGNKGRMTMKSQSKCGSLSRRLNLSCVNWKHLAINTNFGEIRSKVYGDGTCQVHNKYINIPRYEEQVHGA